jgi:hypothetical protein
MGALFRETQSKLLEATVYEKILVVFLVIVEKLPDILCIDVNESMKKITANDDTAKNILKLLSAINHSDTNSAENKAAS